MGRYNEEQQAKRDELWKRLNYLENMSLEDKVAHACDQIERFCYHEHFNVSLSFSGGKDSTVVAHIIDNLAILPRDEEHKIPKVYVNTGLEYPEITEFAKESGAEIIRPSKTFKQVIIENGYPLISKRVSHDISLKTNQNPENPYYKKFVEKWMPLASLPIKISSKCCDVLKKEPFHRYEKETGRVPIRGLTTSESKTRAWAWVNRGGCTAFSDSGFVPACDPISPWKEQDVLRFIKDNDIKIASVYGDIVEDDKGKLKCTGCNRTGCVFCPFGMHREKGETRYQRLARTHPKLYEYSLSGGEWTYENGKQIWIPNSKGLGFAKVFDMVNEIYGKDFYRYEALPQQTSMFDNDTEVKR